MEEQLFTAEEFIQNNEDFYMEIEVNKTVYQAMIEFANMHVRAALESASLKAEIMLSSTGEDGVDIDKKTILDSYPEENIK